jgi:hypothetical protein
MAEVAFCRLCGKDVTGFVGVEAHAQCILWGISTRQFRGDSEWKEACIENGRRVMEVFRLKPVNWFDYIQSGNNKMIQ